MDDEDDWDQWEGDLLPENEVTHCLRNVQYECIVERRTCQKGKINALYSMKLATVVRMKRI
jgi:hypothetical protein